MANTDQFAYDPNDLYEDIVKQQPEYLNQSGNTLQYDPQEFQEGGLFDEGQPLGDLAYDVSTPAYPSSIQGTDQLIGADAGTYGQEPFYNQPLTYGQPMGHQQQQIHQTQPQTQPFGQNNFQQQVQTPTKVIKTVPTNNAMLPAKQAEVVMFPFNTTGDLDGKAIYTEVQPETAIVAPQVSQLLSQKRYQIERYIITALTQMKVSIAQLTTPVPVAHYQGLCARQTQLQNEIQRLKVEIQALEEKFLLDPPNFKLLLRLKSSLLLHDAQLQLYMHELNQLTGNDQFCSVLASLFIVDQPFPCTVKKGKPVGPIELHLLTGARTRLEIVTPCTAELLQGSNLRQRRGKKTEMNHISENFVNNVARFTRLTFTNGSNMNTVNIKFRVTVKAIVNGREMNQSLESSMSKPVIVLTHNDQYHVAVGTLLGLQMFKGINGPKLEIPLNQFCNYLQCAYMEATQQASDRNLRPLWRSDLQYLCATRLNKDLENTAACIIREEFIEFWSWFGPFLQKLRYQKHLQPMWLQGYVWGLLTKSEAECLLLDQPMGSFLVRFSDSRKGGIAVAYRWGESGKKAVRHYMLRPSDTSEGQTFPEFLKNSSTFVRLIQIQHKRGYKQALLRNKDNALIRWYRKKQDEVSISGYDRELLALETRVKGIAFHTPPTSPDTTTGMM